MIPTAKKERQEMIVRMLTGIRDSDKKNEMTMWEEDFIESLEDQYDMKHDLSDRQCEILERIYDKVI